MNNTNWLDADMCAGLGAVLHNASSLNTVFITNLKNQVQDILSRNGFLNHYGYNKIQDIQNTTASYQRFNVEDGRFFAQYTEDELTQRKTRPEMSKQLLKKFRETIFELFSNAVLHSNTKLGIFCCGQLFPKKHTFNFAIADLGVGIPYNIRTKLAQEDITAESAIDWSTKEHNTTKTGKIPGGIGLALLCEFVDKNKGSIQIVSETGYWQRRNKKTLKRKMRYKFPGTIVSIEIKTNDTNTYIFTDEYNEENIF